MATKRLFYKKEDIDRIYKIKDKNKLKNLYELVIFETIQEEIEKTTQDRIDEWIKSSVLYQANIYKKKLYPVEIAIKTELKKHEKK